MSKEYLEMLINMKGVDLYCYTVYSPKFALHLLVCRKFLRQQRWTLQTQIQDHLFLFIFATAEFHQLHDDNILNHGVKNHL